MMKKHVQKMKLLALAAILTLTACGPSKEQQRATAAAQTLEVIAIQETSVMDTLIRLTQTEAAKPPTETPTPTPTETPEPTATLTGLDGPVSPQPGGGVAVGGDQAAYVSDTIVDGTRKNPGQTFTQTWKLRNTGSTTWSTGYALVFVSGEQMNAKSETYLTVPVPPGNIVDISVPMTAPAANGTYQGNFRMRNAGGQMFGTTVWVKIEVGPTVATPTGPTATGTGDTATPTSTPTNHPNFQVTGVDILGSDIRTSITNLGCGSPFYLTSVSARITASENGMARYYWTFQDASPMAEQTITFSSSSTQNTAQVNSNREYIAAKGMGINITINVISPNIIQRTYTYSVNCN